MWKRARLWCGLGLMAAALLLGIIASRTGVQRDGELSLDVALSHERSPLLNVASRAVDIGDGPTVAPVLLALACIVLVLLRRVGTAFEFGAMVAVGWVAAALPKLLVPRPRPGAEVAPLYPEHAPDSFPSGHVAFVAAITAAIAILLWRAHRSPVWPLLLGGVVTLAVAALRLYAGVHWAADVIAAPLFTVGILLAGLPAFGRFRRWVERRTPSRLAPPARRP